MNIKSITNMIRAEDDGDRQIQTNSRLYFLISFLAPISALVAKTSETDVFPSWPKLTAAVIGGLVAGFTAVRAYRDGSYTRHQQTKMFTTPSKPTQP